MGKRKSCSHSRLRPQARVPLPGSTGGDSEQLQAPFYWKACITETRQRPMECVMSAKQLPGSLGRVHTVCSIYLVTRLGSRPPGGPHRPESCQKSSLR